MNLAVIKNKAMSKNMIDPNNYLDKDKARRAPDCVIVIFGAGGDLTRRLLLPTICHLGGDGLLSDNFNLVGVAGHDYNDTSFREYLLRDIAENVNDKKAALYGESLSHRVHYVKGRFENDETFINLSKRLDDMSKKEGASSNYIFYLATPPNTFFTVIKALFDQGMLDEHHGFRRVIIEKPFGHDLDSAIRLNRSIAEVLSEHQIFRIDHYLGKETVQNLLAFRFANGIFEPIWNHHYIDHVQITVAESSGIGSRGKYYDQAGALRDMIPNHAFQLLSLIAMEPPISFESRSVRDEKAKLLRSIECYLPEDVLTRVVRAQYGRGEVKQKNVPAYREEENVNHNSITETYVALKLMIDNWRWNSVPFYIRTGKRLKRRMTEIAIQFKKAPAVMFQKTQAPNLSPNLLVLHIQPEEGISLQFGAKIPGPLVKIGDVNMSFRYKDYFGLKPGTGYETLLYDCMMGDGTLYQRADMVESSWKVVQPILDVFNALKPKSIPHYDAGSAGPKEAERLLEGDGRSWRSLLDEPS
jgi:glucose-6-phosphate 1-dehydrogenase